MDITRKKIERIVIIGLLDEHKKAQAYCHANGFRIIQTNPCLVNEIPRASKRYKEIA